MLRKKNILKILAGILLITLAAGLTYIIKEKLSARNPKNALPTISILYNNAPLPTEHIALASYSWRFLNEETQEVILDGDDWQKISYAPVVPDSPLEISFSYPCDEIKISRAEEGSMIFHEISSNLSNGTASADTADPNTVLLRTPTPSVSLKYTYRIEANWGIRGSVQYYFNIEVRPS